MPRTLGPIRAAARLAALASCVCGSVALGDVPDFYRPWMPDFDQYRFDNPGRISLPNDGRMYCVPTATMNLMAYIDRHGYPTMVDLPENASFFSSSSYNAIGEDLLTLGAVMDTDPIDGTDGLHWLTGTVWWLNQSGQGWKFITVQKNSKQFDPVGPEEFSAYHGAGALMTMSIGWYEPNFNGVMVRTGGHVVTVAGVQDNPGEHPKVLWRDPADTNDDDGEQDAFRVAESHAELEARVFRTDNGDVPLLRYRLTDFDGPAFLGSVVVILPLYGLTSNADLTQLQITHPFGVAGVLQPDDSTVSMPPGMQISGVLANVMGDNFVLARPISGGGPSSLLRIDPSLLQAIPEFQIPIPGPIDVCRKGCVWFIDNRELKKAMPDPEGGFDIGPGLLLPAVVDALATHDGLDRILVLMGNSLRIYDENMALQDTDTLPGQVILSGPVHMSPDPHNPLDLLITSLGSPSIYRIRRDPGPGRWMFIESIPLPSTVDPTDLEVGDDGRIFFRSGGRTFERIFSASGGWATPRDPIFDPAAVGGPFLDIPFSRSNDDAADDEPNDDINLEPRGRIPGVVTCDPDLTTASDPSDPTYGFPDGVLDASDFFYFLDRFVAGDLIVSDLTGASDPNDPAYGAQDGVLDASDFFFYLDLFASGCN